LDGAHRGCMLCIVDKANAAALAALGVRQHLDRQNGAKRRELLVQEELVCIWGQVLQR
jgi:hypothetical protein